MYHPFFHDHWIISFNAFNSNSVSLIDVHFLLYIILIEANNKCSHCSEVPDDDEVIVKCQSCLHDFHSRCLLLKPVTDVFVEMMSANPCVFWFCPGCLSSVN